jgi:hypothetical protein
MTTPYNYLTDTCVYLGDRCGSRGSVEEWFDKVGSYYIMFAFLRRDHTIHKYLVPCNNETRHNIGDLICGWGELPANAVEIATHNPD